jgi:hypothetical protein
MNYRRGFFRAWVVLAVLWVASVAFVSGPDVYSAFDAAAFKALIDKAPIVEQPKDSPIDPNIPVISLRRPEPRAPWLENQPDWTPDPRGWLLRSTAVAVLPPLSLLVLGAMLGWVVGGFRRQA